MKPTPSQPTWHWELTPGEILYGAVLTKNLPAAASVALGFSCPELPLPDHEGFSYQLALSRRSTSSEARELCKEHPAIPDSGDKRSGVVLWADANETPIAGFLISAQWTFSMFVEQAYQSQGFAKLMLLLWFQNVKCPTGALFRNQLLSTDSVKVFLAAHSELLAWAQADGHDVPARVLSAPALQLPK